MMKKDFDRSNQKKISFIAVFFYKYNQIKFNADYL